MKTLSVHLGLAALIFLLAACKNNSQPDILGPGNPSATPQGETSSQQVDKEPQAGGHFLHNFPANRISSGGVPKDGIPALTDPHFVPVAQGNYLLDDDLVLGVVINGEARAYPHNFGWWHEIFNDIIADQPIVVTFCPLTSTGMVFSGGTRQNRVTLGVSGLLFNNNLIMYDRRDGNTLYPQMTHVTFQSPGPGIEGDLKLMPVIETTWRFWKQLYPDSKVIDIGAGAYPPPRYQDYPYGGYRQPSAPPVFPTYPPLSNNATAQRFPPKSMTLGIRFDEMAKAYPFPVMGTEAVINDVLAGHHILVVFYAPEQYAVPFSRQVGAQTLTFDKAPSSDTVYPFMMKDRETGSTWNLKGEAIAGGLAGQKLEQIPAHNAFWFAWATFWQNTGIY